MTSSNPLTKPSAPLQHDPHLVRPLIVGPDSPESPYPLYLEGWVERGFGRGSKELGCPTANLPDSAIAPYNCTLETGVHYGYARVILSPSPSLAAASGSSTIKSGTDSGYATPLTEAEVEEHDKVWPMVMSVGWNPFYDNKTRTAEVHVLHDYPHDFYGKELRVVVLGFVRPEYNYASLDALVKDINTDKLVSLRSLERPAYAAYAQDPFFVRPSELAPLSTDPNAPKAKGPEGQKL